MPSSHTDQIYSPRWPTLVSTSVLVEGLSIGDPRCSNDTCRAFREGFADDERKTQLLGMLSYGKWTVWFYSIWILLFTAIHVSYLLHDRLRCLKKSTGQRPSLKDKTIAFIRFWTYRRPNNHYTTRMGLRQISYGTLTLLTVSTVFFTVLPWPQQQYLRTHLKFGSPPLSVRCALIISALTPLTVALAGKVNVITWITGVGYAKLNVYHRYVSYVIFCLATVHVVPHLVAPVQDGGWALLNKLYANKRRELSGTPLYFTTFGLAFLSIPWMRRRFYEAFKYVHIILGVSYIALLWWHTWGEYISPYYVYATVSILFFSNIIRVVHRHHNLRSFSNLNGFPTTLTHLHGNMTRIAIQVPKSLKWKPGQHAFLRMPSISVTGNHPFLIANIPSSEQHGSMHEMVFLIRRYNGFTKRLYEREKKLVGGVDLDKLVYSDRLRKPPIIITEQSQVVELGKEKVMKRVKSAEHIEDIDAIAAIAATNAITLFEQEVTSRISPVSSYSFSLAITPPTRPTLDRQSSASSFPPRDDITEATLKAITQKPAGIRTINPNFSPILRPCSFRTTPPAYSRTSAITGRRASICSLPPVDPITSAALLSIAQKSAPHRPLRTIVDGAYGTHHRPHHKIYDTVLCIADGSGITACIPHILSLTQHLRHQKKDEIFATRKIHLVWIIRDAEWMSWIERELAEAIRNIREHPSPNSASFTVDIFVTRPATMAERTGMSEDELESLSPISPSSQRVSDSIFEPQGTLENARLEIPSKPRPVLRRLNGGRGLFDEEINFGIERVEGSTNHGVSVAMHYCRPVIKELVEGYVIGQRAVVIGCGPPSMSAELANVTASLQRRVWNGEIREIKLEIETFGW